MTSADRLHAAAAIALALLLAGCTGTGLYPSLARRPAERFVATASQTDAAPVPTPSTLTADLSARLGELRDAAAAAHARFAARRGAVERSVAASGPLGSDSWATASTTLVTLEEAYDQQVAALAALDQLQAEQQVIDAGTASADGAAIAAARDGVAAQGEADGAVLTRLRARLSR